MDEAAREYINFARQLTLSGSYSKAFDFYLMAFDKCGDIKATHEQEFGNVMNRLNEILVSANKMEDIFNNFNRALDAFPDNLHFLNNIGKYLFKYAFYNEAWFHFEKALDLDPTFVNAEKNLNSVKNLLVERWHFRMLNDRVRNEGYRDAIRLILIPIKDSILDLGTGTGLLAMYAQDRKPMAITAVDGSEVMSRLADVITHQNGYDQIVIINKMSTTLNYKDIGGKRSLMLTEMFDAGLFGEHVLQSLAHAWDYLLNPFGRVIPNKVEFFIMGAKSDFLSSKYQLCAKAKELLNIPTTHVHVLNYEETYDCEDVHHYGDDITYITEPQSLIAVDFNNPNDIRDTLKRTEPYEIELKALESGEINSYVGWFNLYLAKNLTITTDPRSKTRANAWQQAIFFDNIPKEVKKDDIVDLEFLINGGKLTMLPEYKTHITRVSAEVLRFLNDIEYMKMISGCIGMACVYMGQMAEVADIHIIDLSPFPMFGLQLMRRGVQSLVCCAKTEQDKHFFKKVFKANDIPLPKITILVGDDWGQEVFRDEKFHAIFCNIFEMCGELDLRFKDIANHLRLNHMIQGGLFMPSNVKLMGQIVHSKWLDINNRLSDENVRPYKMANHVNKYQVSQNFCIDFSHLEYTPLSEPSILGSCESSIGTETISVPITEDGTPNAILCWYHVELMEDSNEISTNRKFSFIDGLVFLCDTDIPMRKGELANVMRCVDPDGSFKVIMVDVS